MVCFSAFKGNGDFCLLLLSVLSSLLAQFEQDYAFMWRLARAYSDAHDMAQDREEKKSMAESGNVKPGPISPYPHGSEAMCHPPSPLC